jgi:hypothetical protein
MYIIIIIVSRGKERQNRERQYGESGEHRQKKSGNPVKGVAG